MKVISPATTYGGPHDIMRSMSSVVAMPHDIDARPHEVKEHSRGDTDDD